MMKYIAFIIVVFFQSVVNSQLKNPKIFYVGYQSYFRDTNSLDTGYLLPHGSTILDFRNNPYTMYRNGKTLSNGNMFLFDKNDSLVMYSNGSKVFNGKHRLIAGADSLSYGKDWSTSPFSGSYYGEYIIRVYPESMLGFQSSLNYNLYHLLSVYITFDSSKHYKIVHSIIDMSLNNGMGKMIQKEVPLKLGDFTESIAACRHANGRDWWIIAREFNNKNFTLFRLHENEIKEVNQNQKSNWDLSQHTIYKSNFSNRFSWDGKYFASYSYEGLELFDFDRCTGQLSNRREFLIPQDDTSSCSMICFSPDNKLIYALLGHKIYQIEISTQIRRKIADWDYREDTMDGGTAAFYTAFGIPQLAPDGKIYISTSEGTRYLHYIDKPNEIGLACDFRQRSIKLLTWNNTMPQFPNYELGADTSCHESSLDELERYKIDIYPNPASARIHIEGTVYETTIYNTLGQQVLISKDKDIDVSYLPVGVYHVLLSGRNGAVLKREKLIIQR